MVFSYIKTKAASIAATGTGNPDWDKPVSNEAYRTAGDTQATDLPVEQVAFEDSGHQPSETPGD